jgi:hypothetical protein
MAAQAGRLPLLATGDTGKLVGLDVVQHHADPAQPSTVLSGAFSARFSAITRW